MKCLILNFLTILSIAVITFVALTIASTVGIWYAILFLVIEAVKDLSIAIALCQLQSRD